MTDKQPSLRLIKKYPNRRLYDTHISRYITLEEIRQLVLDGEEFKVVDKASSKDITRAILLQVIAEQEGLGKTIFSTQLLSRIIRFYDDNLQNVMSHYLEQSMEVFERQQQSVRDQLRQLRDQKPISLVLDRSRDNVNLWKALRDDFLRSLPLRSGEEEKKKDEDKPD
mgnify:CR=1 FL=1